MACRTPTIQDIIMHVHKQEQDSNTHDNIIMKQKIINSTDENLQVRKLKHCYIILIVVIVLLYIIIVEEGSWKRYGGVCSCFI